MNLEIAYEWLYRVALTVLGGSLFFSLFFTSMVCIDKGIGTQNDIG